jgi:hypothetical protein
VLRTERERETQEKTVQSYNVRVKAASTRLAEALTTDPSLQNQIDFALFDFTPSSALPTGTGRSPQTDLAEALLDHPAPHVLMRYLTDHPASMTMLRESETPFVFWRELGRIEGELATSTRRETPKTITDAPEPTETVRTRSTRTSGLDSAVQEHDQAAYKREKLQQRAAMLRR